MAARSIVIVAFDGVQALDVTGPHEVFAGATTLLDGRGDDGGYRIDVVARTASRDAARMVRTESGSGFTPSRSTESSARSTHS